MTAAELITRVAIRNGWTVEAKRSRNEFFIIATYDRGNERVQVWYTPSDSVHSSLYTNRHRHELIDYFSPASTGRRAATIRWLKS